MFRNTRTAAAALTLIALGAVGVGCGSGASSKTAGTGCPAALTRAKAAVEGAGQVDTAWDGPTTGPRATSGKTIVYIAQTMINPGVAGVAKGMQQAAKAIGWHFRVIDGQGTPAGIQAAFSQALVLNPSGIVVGGFDPGSTADQVAKAKAAGIPLVGWHAVAAPGPSRQPPLFTNVTTRVEKVAKISADWIIAESDGKAGAVIFTDASVPFARNKSELIKKELATCSSVKLLSYENIPLQDSSSRTPQQASSLLSRFGNQWTHSAAINDLYFADAAPALRAAGKQGSGAPYNVGAGDGDPSAFARVRDRQYQAATVPEPLLAQGWQIIDEFNRAFTGQPASSYVAPVHITTADNVRDTTLWDPTGYRTAYLKIWGKQ